MNEDEAQKDFVKIIKFMKLDVRYSRYKVENFKKHINQIKY